MQSFNEYKNLIIIAPTNTHSVWQPQTWVNPLGIWIFYLQLVQQPAE